MGKFLASLLNLVVRGDIKKIEQAFKFARQEFGEITPLLKKQIERIFSQVKKPKVGKEVKKEAEVVPFKKEGIETLKNDKSIMDQIDGSKNKIEGASNRITEIQKEIDAMYKPKPDVEDSSDLMKRLEDKVSKMKITENISTGLTRTIAREILGKKGIELPKGSEPLEVFKQKFGQDVLIDVNNLAEELIEMDRQGIKPKPLTQLIEEGGFFDVKMPKEPPQGFTPDELADVQKEVDQENILLKFDPTDRDPNAEGGRIGYADGNDNPKKLIKKIPKVGKIVSGLESLKGAIGKVMTKFGEDAITTADKAPIPSKTLERDMFKAADNRINKKEGVFMEDGKTPDYDYYKEILDDAEDSMGFNVAGDETIEELLKREKTLKDYEADMYDQYKTGKLDPEPGSKSQARLNLLKKRQEEAELTGDYRLFNRDDAEELDELEEFLDQDYKRVKAEQAEEQAVKELAPKMVERLKLKQKYPGITDDLLDKILIDDNPQRKAEVLGSLDETFKMMEKGMSPDEIIETFKNVTRTKQADGGFNTITLDKEFTKVFEDASSKKLAARDEKQATREKRYRELIASNKFPELNNFFREKIIPRVQANIGGAFTTGQRQQRANQSYQDYLARQQTSGTAFRPGPGNNPVVNFPTFNPPTTTPTPPTTTPTPPPSGGGGGGGGTGGGSVYPGITPPNYIPPNTGGGGGSSGGGGGSSGGGGGGGSTMPISQPEVPPMNSPQPMPTPPGGGGATGAEALAAYRDYVQNLTNGSPVGFDSFRRGTKYEGSMTFTSDDFMALQKLKDAVNSGWKEDGSYDRTDLDGYLGPDPRGTGPGYTEEGEGSQKAPPGYEGDDSETFLEKKKREEAEAAEAEAAKKEQEEGGGADYFPETETISKISEAAKTVDTSDPSQYSQFINANANATVGKDSRGKIFTLANLIKAGLFVASGGLSGGIEQAITTAAKQYAKKKAVEYAKEKIGIGSSQEELPETALSNNLIGSNTNLQQYNKGGRVKLYNGGIPGFTETEIAQRRNQQLRDAQERNRTSSQPITQMPMIPPGGAPKQPANLSPITNSPFPGTGAYTPPAMSEQGALPGFGTNNPGGEEYIAVPGGGGPSTSPGDNTIFDPFGMPMQMKNPGMPGEMTDPVTGQPQDPMLAKFGIAMSDYDKMNMDQQDDLHAAVEYTEQYGREPYTQAMILKERGINPDQFMKADGSYDRLALTQKTLETGITDLFTKSADPVNRQNPEMAEYFKIEDAKKDLIPEDLKQRFMPTGNESFRELQELEKKAFAAFNDWESSMEQQYSNTPGHPFYNPPYQDNQYGAGTGGGEAVYTPGEQVKKVIGYQPSDGSPGNSLMASGGRAGFKFGSMLETSNPNFGKPKKDKSHEYLLRLLKSKQDKQLNSNLRKMVSKSRQVKDKSPEQIAKALKKLQQLKSFYGKR